MERARPKIALTIAASDPSGGAGVQGDLRTFAACGVHALSAVTAITVQGTRGVRAVHPVEAAVVRAQIEVVLGDVAADIAKTGALVTADIVREVCAAMEARPRLPLVVDPVMAASSGAPLLDEAGVRVMIDRLVPRAMLVTPNLSELAVLAGDRESARDVEEIIAAAERLLARGARAVLAKGGHLEGDPIDVFVGPHGPTVFPGNRIVTSCTHGTGCTLSAAIAASIANGADLENAIAAGRRLLIDAMSGATPIGEGTSPLDPFVARVGPEWRRR